MLTVQNHQRGTQKRLQALAAAASLSDIQHAQAVSSWRSGRSSTVAMLPIIPQ
jgi:hypothetical protein